ncbi:heparan-alpha-glucosaminide N-acetyltransferase domain-containing protein [Planococcus sp. APC 4015]|nr:heparan-alpha-glucosaminide N-acetyltransferase domain-containing protein [Planococcus sp. APC 4015]
MTEPTGWLATRWARLNGPQRVTGVDLARGLAVVGMLAAHLLAIDVLIDWGDPSTWIAVVDGRSSILFALLAGVSIGLTTGGATPIRGSGLASARLRLVVRAVLLWVLGLMLIVTGVPVYVILPAYAILFLLTLPFLSFGPRVLLPLAGALAVVMPFVQVVLETLPIWTAPGGGDLALAIGWHYPFPVWIAFVLAGLGVARAGIRRWSVQLWMLGAGVSLAVLGYGLGASSPGIAPWTSEPHSSGLFEVLGSGGFALAVLAACLLVCRTVLVWVVLPLRAVGAMPLTAYTAQLVAWAIIATIVLGRAGDLTGFRDLDPFGPMTLVLVATCTAWALLIGRGPLEWVLDVVSRLVPSGRPEPVRRDR